MEKKQQEMIKLVVAKVKKQNEEKKAKELQEWLEK